MGWMHTKSVHHPIHLLVKEAHTGRRSRGWTDEQCEHSWQHKSESELLNIHTRITLKSIDIDPYRLVMTLHEGCMPLDRDRALILLQIAGLLQQKSSFRKEAEVFFSWFFEVLSTKSKNRFDFAGNSTKNLKFSVKKTSASFQKDAVVAKDLQYVVIIFVPLRQANLVRISKFAQILT